MLIDNYFPVIKIEQKDIDNKDSRFVLAQRMREQQTFSSWIDIYIEEEVECDNNFDAIAKAYSINVNSMIKDDTSNDTFFRSMRMAEVLNSLMTDYFKQSQEYGFILGEVIKNTYPGRVLVSGGKTLKSGVTYNIIIQ